MPHANIWIRKHNEERWNAIEDKSAFVNLALAGTDVPKVNSAIKQKKEIEEILKPHLEQLKPTALSSNGRITDFGSVHEGSSPSEATKPLKQQKYCKNGHALDERGRCFGKGCKYA